MGEVNHSARIPAEDEGRRVRILRYAAVLSYFVGYFYLRYCIGGRSVFAGPVFAFTLIFIAGVEALSVLLGHGPAAMRARGCSLFDAWFCAACAVAQAAAILVWGLHAEPLIGAQIFFWHFTLIYYVYARTGMLAAGRTGVLFPLDAAVSMFWLPWANLFLRVKSLFVRRGRADRTEKGSAENSSAENSSAEKGIEENSIAKSSIAEKSSEGEMKAPDNAENATRNRAQTAVIAGVTITAAVVVSLFAIVQLAGVTESFAGLGKHILDAFSGLFRADFWHWLGTEFLPWFLLSIPVSAWLFGLCAGGLLRREAPVTYRKFSDSTRGAHIFPAYSAYLVIGALLAVYTIFFLVSVRELAGLLHIHQAAGAIAAQAGDGAAGQQAAGGAAISAAEASNLAVNGFWQLVRIVVLNFAVLGGFALLSDVPLWERRSTRILTTVLFLYATVFAMIAGWKLYMIYIGIFGSTPRRILSGWVLAVLLLWCVLVLIRLYRRIPAVRIGILSAAASFSVLMLCNIEKITGIPGGW